MVGPSFDLVNGWAARGVPIKIAFEGIDRAFERYHSKGPRRRPLKIDFCDADVLDVFEEWQRAVGITHAEAAQAKGPSLPEHLKRVVRKLSEARASGALGDAFDETIDRISDELDTARAEKGGLRGDARKALLDRLTALDAELLAAAGAAIGQDDRAALEAEAVRELAPYRERMAPDAFDRARTAAEQRLLRDRFGLPTVGMT